MKYLRGPEKMTSRAGFGTRAVVWRPMIQPMTLYASGQLTVGVGPIVGPFTYFY